MRLSTLAGVGLLIIVSFSGCLGGDDAEPKASEVNDASPTDSSPSPTDTPTRAKPSPSPRPSQSPAPTTEPPEPPINETPPEPPAIPEIQVLFNLTTVKAAAADSKVFRIDPAMLNVTKTVRLNVTVLNGDPTTPNGLNHSLKIPDWAVDLSPITPGNSTTFELLVDREGSFEYFCGEAQHKELGMKGTLNVADGTEPQ